MDLKELKAHWDRLGEVDPYWAILSSPETLGNRWDLEQFFETGRVNVATFLDVSTRLGLPARRGAALDFGCGVGRLTQALADHFESVEGVDIASSMIALAKRFNRHGGRCRYHINTRDDLSLFPDAAFDFILAYIVLQHIPPEASRRYIREFVRVLRPGGLALFQLPTRPTAVAPPEVPGPPPAPLREFAAAVVLLDPPEAVEASRPFTLKVRVTNKGREPWPHRGDARGGFRVQVGNHWRTAGGELLALDDGRAPLPAPVAPGESVVLDLAVTAPPLGAGAVLLEVDVVQEHVAWFAQRGSRAAVHTLRLTAGEAPAADGPVAPAADADHHMDMYGVLEEVVREEVRSAGGRVVSAERDHSAGPEWESLLYAVTR